MGQPVPKWSPPASGDHGSTRRSRDGRPDALARVLGGLVQTASALPALCFVPTVSRAQPVPGDWPSYNRTLDGRRFSPLRGNNQGQRGKA